MHQHDLSPARFFRRRATAAVDTTQRSARSGAGHDPGGAWVHLKAWMRVQHPASPRQRPAHG